MKLMTKFLADLEEFISTLLDSDIYSLSEDQQNFKCFVGEIGKIFNKHAYLHSDYEFILKFFEINHFHISHDLTPSENFNSKNGGKIFLDKLIEDLICIDLKYSMENFH